MQALTFKTKLGAELKIDVNKAQEKTIGTKSIYVRIGFKNKSLFISQRGNGEGGAGDVIRLTNCEDKIKEVSDSLFYRIKIFAEKNSLIIN